MANERGAISDYYKELVNLAREYGDTAIENQKIFDDWNRLANGIVPEPERKMDWTWAEQNDYRDDGYEEPEQRDNWKSRLSQEEREELYKQEKQLAYGRLDDFSKYELEKERQRLVDEHNEELYSVRRRTLRR